jgi:hypothetical protein
MLGKAAIAGRFCLPALSGLSRLVSLLLGAVDHVPVYTNRASRATRGTRHVRKWSMRHQVPLSRVIATSACLDLSFSAWYGLSKGRYSKPWSYDISNDHCPMMHL